MGRGLLCALDKLGVEVACWPIGAIEAPPEQHEVISRAMNRQCFYDPKAPSVRCWHQFALAEHIGRGERVALPIFELDRFKPHELHHLKSQDLVLATTAWARSVLVESGIGPVGYCPLGVDSELFKPVATPTQEGAPTVFLSIGKWEVRKGHDFLAEAFSKAFTLKDNVVLVMASYNPCFADPARGKAYNDGWVQLYKTAPMGQRTQIIIGRLPTQADVALLMSKADCGVFPARAEGWGLESLEMMAMGKSVILTACSGHLEYATPANARLIEVDQLEPAHDGVWFHSDDPAWGGNPGRWATLGPRQMEQTVAHLRQVHQLKQQGQLRANEEGIQTGKKFSWENAAKELMSSLD